MRRPYTIRSTPRAACNCSIRYFGKDYLGIGRIWDLSLAGGRASGNTAVSVGAELIVHIQLPGDLGEDWYWVDKAIVRWSAGKSFGIEILSMGQENREFLTYALGEFE